MGYAESKFYDRLDELAGQMLKGEITQEQLDEKSLEFLDEELGWPNGGGDWLAGHFGSSAEMLHEGFVDPDVCSMPADYMIDQAKKEIAVLRKHGYDTEADYIERLISEYYMMVDFA